MKRFIFALATLISTQSFAASIYDHDIKKDLMKISCYTGKGRYAKEVITGQRESPYKPFIIKATWEEQGRTVNQDLKVDFVGEMGVTYVTGITIRGFTENATFELAYNPKNGAAGFEFNRDEKTFRSVGGALGLTCTGIFRN